MNLTNSVQGGNLALSKAGLATGTTTTSTIGSAVNYTIGGKFQAQKAAASNFATPTTDAVSGKAFNAMSANQACAFLYALDSAGNVKVAQGKIVPWLDTSANSTPVPLPRDLPDTLTPFGYLVVKAGATLSGTWLFGSNNWSTTGITVDTAVDIMTPPAVDPLTA
jgi:hypothetical protein